MTELKIVYIDDEPDIREVAEIALSLDPGIEVRTFGSGPEGLKALDDGIGPDLIMLDVMMPGMDGPAVLAEIRKRLELNEVPVVFITARAKSHEQARFLGLGAVAVITKPFDPMTLAQQLRAIAAREVR